MLIIKRGKQTSAPWLTLFDSIPSSNLIVKNIFVLVSVLCCLNLIAQTTTDELKKNMRNKNEI